MQNSKNAWVLVTVVVIATIIASVTSLQSQGQDRACSVDQGDNKTQNSRALTQQERVWKEFESKFPVTEYDTPVSSDSKAFSERILKNNRYDNRGVLSVFSSLPEDGEGLTHSLGSLPYNGIPFAESEIVAVGEILSANAYLSNNKKAVYSEFTFRVDEIIKKGLGNVIKDNRINFDRQGGVVRYSNGKTRVYNIREFGMPQIGRQYVLFLKNSEKSLNYELITGYELKADNKVINLDDFPQFEEFKGIDREKFLKSVRQSGEQPSQTTSNQQER